MNDLVHTLVAAVLGVLTWTLFEYVIHRWLGHDRRFRRTPFGVEHLRHHLEGDYFAPTWKKAMAAALVAAVLCVPAIWLVGTWPGIAFVAGLMSFYGVYELVHRREHTHAGVGPYGRWLRRHHFSHHLVDARGNFGVTSPIWDVAFRTRRAPPEVIKVPLRLRMAWLVAPGSDALQPAHAARYVIAAPPRR